MAVASHHNEGPIADLGKPEAVIDSSSRMRRPEEGFLEVIPVIDLRGGVVVRAQGHLVRREYPPLRSPLCPDASPRTLLRALEASPAFRTVYIADLDALSGHAGHWPLITELAASHPHLDLWIDVGLGNACALAAMPVLPNVNPVIGSETWQDAPPPAPLAARCVFSLDFRGCERVGVARLDLPQGQHAGLRVILMCLDRMGQQDGPDFQRLAEARARAPTVNWMLAGGIRNAADVRKAGALGASGVLVSSALHRGDLAPG